MNKREFIIQYVLNRAKAHAGGMGGKVAVHEAAEAWDTLYAMTSQPIPPATWAGGIAAESTGTLRNDI